MSATLGSMVEGILDHLYGHAAQQDAVTSLSTSLDASATSFQVDDASIVGAGLIEVDSEIMRVKAVDLGSNTVTLTPTGRGQRGSAPATHSAGAEVRVAPIMPYFSVIREVNAEISSLYPWIPQVATAEFTSSPVTNLYGLPADVDFVLDVRYRVVGTTRWERVRTWEMEHNQNTTDYPTGITLHAVAPASTTVRVIYGKRFGTLATLTDTLSSVGVPEACEDIVRMGALLRLLPSMDMARLSVISVPSADANDKPPQPGTGIMIARELKQQYVARREQEVGAFRLQYPVRQHYTR